MKRNLPGNPKIGAKRIELQSKHCQEVYEAVYHLNKKVKVKDILKYLDGRTKEIHKKIEKDAQAMYDSGLYARTYDDLQKELIKKKSTVKTVSERTIERCIKLDSRISKEGWYYYIDDKTRFEKRHLDPHEFGIEAYSELMYMDIQIPSAVKTENEKLEFEMKETIRRIGTFMAFLFLEAAKPFEDKSMDISERDKLVHYWVRNAIPIDRMYQDFLGTFDQRHRNFHKMGFGEAQREMRQRLESGSFSIMEMDKDSIRNTVEIMRKIDPDLYNQFNHYMENRDWTVGLKGYVRGKSYRKHFPPNWKDWLE